MDGRSGCLSKASQVAGALSRATVGRVFKAWEAGTARSLDTWLFAVYTNLHLGDISMRFHVQSEGQKPLARVDMYHVDRVNRIILGTVGGCWL